MPDYKILTDSGSDLPESLLRELDVNAVSLNLHFRGETLADSVSDDIRALYAALRAGESASTSAVNPEGWIGAMEPVLRSGLDILTLTFSSGLSTTYQSAVIAANELLETYPDRKIRVVDTRCASLGQGLLVYHACKQRDGGMGLDALADWAEETKTHLCHWFTVDDLMFLKRGGRISTLTAIAGTMLKIKPVLHMDDAGHLVNRFKTRGRRAAMDALADKLGELGQGWDNGTCFICHGDCPADAEYLAEQIKTRFGVREVFIGYTGAVIGSHSGPGTLSLFFLGSHR